MSRGLGALQREIKNTLDRAAEDLHQPLRFADLRAAFITKDGGDPERGTLDPTRERSVKRALKGLVDRGEVCVHSGNGGPADPRRYLTVRSSAAATGRQVKAIDHAKQIIAELVQEAEELHAKLPGTLARQWEDGRQRVGKKRLRAPSTDPAMLGTSGYARRLGDFYSTERWVTETLLSKVRFRDAVWEPAAGDGAMVRVLASAGYPVVASDLVGDARGCPNAIKLNFLVATALPEHVLSIVTNPPYGKLAEAFIRQALRLTEPVGGMIAMLARNEYDSANTRKGLFDGPPFACKITLTKRPRWSDENVASPRHNFAWYVWDWQHVGPSHLLHAP